MKFASVELFSKKNPPTRKQAEEMRLKALLAKKADALRASGINSALNIIYTHLRRNSMFRFQWSKLRKLINNSFLLLIKKPIDSSDSSLEFIEQAVERIALHKSQKLLALREIIEALILLRLQRNKYRNKAIIHVVGKIEKLGRGFIRGMGIAETRSVLNELANILNRPSVENNENNNSLPGTDFSQKFILEDLNLINAKNSTRIAKIIKSMITHYGTETKEKRKTSTSTIDKYVSAIKQIKELYKNDNISSESILFFFKDFWDYNNSQETTSIINKIARTLTELETRISKILSTFIFNFDTLDQESATKLLLRCDDYLVFIDLLKTTIDSINNQFDMVIINQLAVLNEKLEEYKKSIFSIKDLMKKFIANIYLKKDTFIYSLQIWQAILETQSIHIKNTQLERTALLKLQISVNEKILQSKDSEEFFLNICEEIKSHCDNINELNTCNQKIITDRNIILNQIEEFYLKRPWDNHLIGFFDLLINVYTRFNLNITEEKQKIQFKNYEHLFNLDSQLAELLNMLLECFQIHISKANLSLKNYLNIFKILETFETIFIKLYQRQVNYASFGEIKPVTSPCSLKEHIDLINSKIATCKSLIPWLTLGPLLISATDKKVGNTEITTRLMTWRNILVMQQTMVEDLTGMEKALDEVAQALKATYQTKTIDKNLPYKIDTILKTQQEVMTNISLVELVEKKIQGRNWFTNNNAALSALGKPLEMLINYYVKYTSMLEELFEKGQINVHPQIQCMQILQNNLKELTAHNNQLKASLCPSRVFSKRKQQENIELRPDKSARHYSNTSPQN